MNLIFAIYTNTFYKEIRLPSLDNANYNLVLSGEDYDLQADLCLQMEVIDGVWKFKGSTDYQIFCESHSFEEKEIISDIVLHIQSRKGERLIAFVWSGEDELKAFSKFYLTGSRIVIGKSKDCDICISEKMILSHIHAVISYEDGRLYVEDKSRNGTYLDNKRLTQKEQVSFGSLINIFGVSIICLGRYLVVHGYGIDIDIRENNLKSVTEIELDDRTQKSEMYISAETMVHISPREIPKLFDGEEMIEPVPQKKEADKKPAWMTILPSLTMVLPMILGYSLMNNGNMSMGIIISGGAAVVGVTWAIINLKYNRKTIREEELLRLKKYEDYLVQKADEIREKFEYNKKSLTELYPPAEICSSYNYKSPYIWTRKPENTDFLFVRLGVGEQPFQVDIKTQRKQFSLSDDELFDRAGSIARSFAVMENVPIGVSLLEHSVVGIVTCGDEKRSRNIERVILTQIAANHSYTDVKLVVLGNSDENDLAEINYTRWLPHIWNEERTLRYYASNEIENSDVFYSLTQIFRARDEQKKGFQNTKNIMLPHYVLIVENPKYLERQPITKYLFENGHELGVTTVLFADKYENLPSSCEFVIQSDKEFEGVYQIEETGSIKTKIKFDEIERSCVEAMARRMSSYRVNQIETSSDIPSSLTFFEMMGVRDLDELNVVDRWKKNRTYESMQALIGQKAGGQNCYLDINEKYHGPHGLLAGTTGSGKSETLQTYILSLAINYSPLDIGLFLIDFKGGGMANLFADLPHTMGVISNLSGNQVHRAMVSITSEITRRQRIFGDFGVNHIDGYTKLIKNGEATVPIPHLLIIIDEFAELKREEPEFMKKLINVAQVGRSLGVHLILATQKPSGTVDDNIWSNTKFRICLRVADKQDSNDMLHRPDAAFLTQTGRGYLQVGNNEIFELFQSGWSGAVYDADQNTNEKSTVLVDHLGRETNTGRKLKSEKKKKATMLWMKEIITYSLDVLKGKSFIAGDLNVGELELVSKAVIQKINEKEVRFSDTNSNVKKLSGIIQTIPRGEIDVEKFTSQLIDKYQILGKPLPEIQEKTQLDVIVKYLSNISKRNGFENKQTLWMPVLPTQLSLADLPDYSKDIYTDNSWTKHEKFELCTAIGLVDDPENQMQYPVSVDLCKKGHLLVAGNVTSGKSTFLQTMLYGLITRYSPQELAIYAIDFSSQMLCPFEGDSHVGGVVIEGEDDRLNKLFGMIMDMLQTRKKRIRGGNFEQFVNTYGNEFPAIVLVIDGYENFREKTEDRFGTNLLEISRNAEGYGIYLAVSCTSIGSTGIQSKIADNIRQKICLELTDKYSYSAFLGTNHFSVLPDSNVKGRGLVNIEGNILEYQTALSFEADNDYARSERIKASCESMSSTWNGKRARQIPEIPAKPTWQLLTEHSQYNEMLQENHLLPVAYNQIDASLYGIDLVHYYRYLILGRERSGKSVFLRNIACAARTRGGKLFFIDRANKADLRTAQLVNATYVSEPADMKEMVKELILCTNSRGAKRKELLNRGFEDEEVYAHISEEFEPVFVFISDFADFLRVIYTEIEGVGKLNAPVETIFAKGRLLNVFFFAALDVGLAPALLSRPAYTSFISEKMGVLLGGELSKQNIFSYQNVKFSEQNKRMKTGFAYAVNPEDISEVNLIVFPQNKGITEV